MSYFCVCIIFRIIKFIFQLLDLFAVTLRQIGAYIGRMHLEDAVKVLKDGDGNNNAAKVYEVGSNPIGGSKGALSYDALLDFWAQFDPYTMNTMLVSNDMMLAMLKLSEFQNPNTGLNFQATGKLTTPLGAKLLRSSAVPAGTIIGLDKNYALEQICGSEVVVEYDKLIDRQGSHYLGFRLCQAVYRRGQGAEGLSLSTAPGFPVR